MARRTPLRLRRLPGRLPLQRRAASASLDPAALAALDDEGFARTFAGSAIRRATAEGLRRNARAALEAAR